MLVWRAGKVAARGAGAPRALAARSAAAACSEQQGSGDEQQQQQRAGGEAGRDRQELGAAGAGMHPRKKLWPLPAASCTCSPLLTLLQAQSLPTSALTARRSTARQKRQEARGCPLMCPTLCQVRGVQRRGAAAGRVRRGWAVHQAAVRGACMLAQAPCWSHRQCLAAPRTHAGEEALGGKGKAGQDGKGAQPAGGEGAPSQR